MSGKAYANRKKSEVRPFGDYYATPRSVMWVAKDVFKTFFNVEEQILDPCCGSHIMKDELVKMGFKNVCENDIILDDGVDYLDEKVLWNAKQVVMNPPFSKWNEFVQRAKQHATKIAVIGRLNYLSTQSRYENGIWWGLNMVLPFTRYIDYQTPVRNDGCFYVGAMATGWFLFDMNDVHSLPMMGFLDVQKYATLGNFNK